MQRKILLYSSALLSVLFFCLLFVIPHSIVLAHGIATGAPTPTPTLDPVKILNQSNAVATQAADAAARSDSAATTVNTVASGLNIVLVLLSVVAAALSVLGIVTVAELNKRVEQVNSAIKAVNIATAKVKEVVGKANLNLVDIANDVTSKADARVAQAVESLSPKVEELRKEVTYLLRGYQLLERGKKDQAVKAFEMALDIWQTDAQANYALGRIYSGDKSYAKAIRCLKTAISSEPNFPAARMELGLVLRRQADQLFEGATKGKTKDLNDEVLKKAIKQHDEEYREAIGYLKEAEKSLPGDEDILGALGGIYRRQGMYETALVYYHDTLSANPNSSYALGNIASLSYHIGNQQMACKAFEDTILLATKRIDAHDSREPWWDYYDRAMAKLVLRQIGDDAKNYEAEGTSIDDYKKAIELTLNSESFESVLNGLNFLKEAESKYNPPNINGLEEIIILIKNVKVEMEAREKAQKVGKEKAEIKAQTSVGPSTNPSVEAQPTNRTSK